jgi:hypothetical protein
MPLALLSWVLLSQPTANTPAKDVELKELDVWTSLGYHKAERETYGDDDGKDQLETLNHTFHSCCPKTSAVPTHDQAIHVLNGEEIWLAHASDY